MSDMHTDPSQTYSSDVAFTPAVKAVQTRKGSRDAYARVEQNGGWRTEVDENLAHFLAETNSFFLATASGTGHPYIQHRGGPKGFVKVIDKNTIAFADYSGNRQYITQGNLSENPQAHIFVMDYAHRRRVKIWGEARVVDDDPALTKALMPQGYKARPEQVILFRISAWDTNCPQHIPQKFDAADVAAALASRDGRIAELEAELAALKGQPVSANQGADSSTRRPGPRAGHDGRKLPCRSLIQIKLIAFNMPRNAGALSLSLSSSDAKLGPNADCDHRGAYIFGRGVRTRARTGRQRD